MNFGTIQVANIFVGTLNAIEAYFGNEKVWGKSEPATPNWLCFTAEQANSTVAMQAKGSAPTVSLEYSTDGNTWSPFVVSKEGVEGTTVTLANIGDKMYMRATSSGNTGMGSSSQNYNKFVMTGKISASGNVDTLLDQNGNATITDYCYSNLFNDCSSLTTAPELPATTLADSCYDTMFFGCTSLTQAPELPATTLAAGCYDNMFFECTSLTTAPELPATTLADSCYNRMFYGCTSLTSAPELPATTLANYCYSYMFSGCDSLTTAPELPATTLAEGCYQTMFSGCSNLNTIKLGYTGNFADAPSDAFSNWVSGVASTGTFYYNGSDTTTGTSAIPTGWTVVSQLCFTAEEANSTLRLDKVGSPNAISLETSTDGNTWTDYSWTENTGDTLTLANISDKVYMRAKTENQTIGSSNTDYYKFVMTGKIAASGNIQTLLKADGSRTDAPAYCYKNLFNGCTSLTSAPELPATKLYAGCYSNMFSGCTSLTTAPELPSTTLAAGCYSGMFYGCTSLTQAPLILPSTTLDNGCYSGMFYGCTSLTQAPELPATTLAYGCYQNMFRNCTSLTTAPRLPATTLINECYRGLFYGCTNLNSITLDYTGNFSTTYFNYWVSGVASTGTFYYNGSDTTTGVSAIPTGWTVLPTPIPIPRQELCFTAEEPGSDVTMMPMGDAPAVSLEYSTNGVTWSPFVVGSTTVTLANIGDKMYMRATSSGNTGMGASYSDYNQFVMTGKISASGNVDTLLDQNGNATLTYCCYYGLFKDCTSLTTAPELPATTLEDGCYKEMFFGCSSLTTAPELPATKLAYECYESMFNGCTSLTQAPTLPATTLADSCYLGMFTMCESLISAPELPATTLASGCYGSMFNGCTSLTTAPELPATTLANGCYSNMFLGCTSLTQAPAIKTYTPELYAFDSMLNVFEGAQGKLTSCNWPDLTLSEAQSMVLDEVIFGSNDPGENVRISITCKDGSGTAYYDSANFTWVFE